MARTYPQPTAGLAPLRMSYEAWQSWLGVDEVHRGEWIDGEVIVFAMPKHLHQAALLWLARLLAEFVDRRNLGEVGFDGTEMWLPSRRTARLPDLFFVRTANLDRLGPDRLEGPADLAVEIVSDDSVTRDHREKFLEYQAAGIPEYWIADPRPRRQTFAMYSLDAHGSYQEIPSDANGYFQSRVLAGLWIDPAWLWQTPRPKPYEVIARILAGQADSLP